MNTITVTLPWFHMRKQEGWWQERWLCCSQESSCGENDTSLSPRVWTVLTNSAFPLTFLFCLIFLMNPVCLISRIFIVLKALLLLPKIGPSQRWEQWNIHLIKITGGGTAFCYEHTLAVERLLIYSAALGCRWWHPCLSIQLMTTWEQAEPPHVPPASPQTQGALHLPETYRERTQQTQQTGVPKLLLSLPSCVISEQLLHLSEFQFFICSIGWILTRQAFSQESNEAILSKFLAWSRGLATICAAWSFYLKTLAIHQKPAFLFFF